MTDQICRRDGHSVVVRMVGAFLGLVLIGCQQATPPAEAPNEYAELMRVAGAQGQAQSDTSFFWLRNTGTARARSLMLDLGVSYLYFDRQKGVLCVWSGEGLWSARGYVTSVPAGRPQTDSVGVLCDIEGDCTASVATDTWAAFECR